MFEAMQLISGQLKQLPPQSSEVGNVLRDVFGRSGKDAVGFIRNLSEVNTELSVIQGNLQDGEKLQMRWAEALAEFHSIGSQVFTGTDDMVTALKATMVEWVNAAIKGTVNLINYFIDLYNESAIFRGAMEGIAFVVKSTFDMMGHSLRQLVNLFTGFGKIWGAILKGEFSKVREIAKESLGEMVEDGKAFGQKLADNFNTAVSNTLGEREKIQAITLSAEAAEAAGKTTGLNYANGFKTGAASVAAAKVATPYVDEGMGPQQFDIAKMQEQNYEAARLAVAKQREAGLIDQKQYNSLMLQAEMEFTENMLKLATLRGEYTTGIELKHAELQIQANEALVVSYQELGSAAAGSLNTIASAVGGAASSWFTFFGVLAEQIPALIASIQSMTGAQVASSGAIIAAKQGEATAGAVAGASKMPFPASLIAMLASVAAVASIFMAIPKFAFGGIVPGGSFGGDNMLIRANSGEEVLRRDDPRHQFNQKASNRGIAGVVVNLVQDGLYIDGDKLRILLRKSDEKLALRTVNYG